mmetsp:Transcript_57180/g.140614  ORF Transcript_57180/g.140614 Transcript_57180/m.140614 type:complete len:228 (+) Transcript_57180:71-754(+)
MDGGGFFAAAAVAVAALVYLTHRRGAPARGSDVLAVAKRVASTQFGGWTYGSDPAARRVNCVQSMEAVLVALEGSALPTPVRRRLHVADVDAGEIDTVVPASDECTRGVQSALVMWRRGNAVARPDHLVEGDFVQYWMQKSDGSWFGHAAIVANVRTNDADEREAQLYGSHASTDGIATTTFWLRLIESTMMARSRSTITFATFRSRCCTGGTWLCKYTMPSHTCIA